MATVAIVVGGAILNAATFIGGNYLAKALGGSDDATLDEKKRHDKALEDYQAAYAKYNRQRTQLLDWIQTNEQIKAHAKQNFTNTDYAFKLYNQAYPNRLMAPLKEPKFSISTSRASSKKGRAGFFGRRVSCFGLCCFPFPLNIDGLIILWLHHTQAENHRKKKSSKKFNYFKEHFFKDECNGFKESFFMDEWGKMDFYYYLKDLVLKNKWKKTLYKDVKLLVLRNDWEEEDICIYRNEENVVDVFYFPRE